MKHLVIAFFILVILNPYKELEYYDLDELIIYDFVSEIECVIVIIEPTQERCIGIDGLKYWITYPTSDVEIID